MEAEVVAAIIGGGFTLVGTLAAGLYQIRASRTKETSGTVASKGSKTKEEASVEDQKPRPVPKSPLPSPKSEPKLPLPDPGRRSDDPFDDLFRPPSSPPFLVTKEYEIKENDPVDPFYRTLSRVRPKNAYPRLKGKELDSQFLTDCTMNYRDGDRLEFSDGSQE
ncbi:hypothetical protein [Streptosporangium sp. NPDC006930]|uniref:hypothetical protein n=1 Tax=Streptosporangium sp. NPDC006930 TaxID=3154783 RepID=UPI0034338D81